MKPRCTRCEGRARVREAVIKAGGYPILLDELSGVVLRYMEEHPHLTRMDVLPTVEMLGNVVRNSTLHKRDDEPQFDEDLL